MSFLSECSSGGCGAKIGPGELQKALARLPTFSDPALLVGFSSSDDAAAYRLSEDTAILSTVDFFSPMVDDPKTFGKIAATNALSDIYAMGGEVLFALNLVCFPQRMDPVFLEEMLLGGAEKMGEAGALLCGGHSIYDHEPKYGLAVTGRVAPDRLLKNDTCRPGDCLILTKALGVGLILSAQRAGLASAAAYKAAVASMERLNRYAAEKMRNYPVSACTDVTGFGLLIHAKEMAADRYTLAIDLDALPILPEALLYAKEDLYTAAGQRNRNFLGEQVDLSAAAPPFQEILLDPQTSGGLLISVPAASASALLQDIQMDDPAAALIGEVLPREGDSPLLLL